MMRNPICDLTRLPISFLHQFPHQNLGPLLSLSKLHVVHYIAIALLLVHLAVEAALLVLHDKNQDDTLFYGQRLRIPY